MTPHTVRRGKIIGILSKIMWLVMGGIAMAFVTFVVNGGLLLGERLSGFIDFIRYSGSGNGMRSKRAPQNTPAPLWQPAGSNGHRIFWEEASWSFWFFSVSLSFER